MLFAISLPMLFGLLGLVVDGGLAMSERCWLRQIADVAATAAARTLARGGSPSEASETATTVVRQQTGLANAEVVVHCPPSDGAYAGRAGYVEVVVTRPVATHFMHIVNGHSTTTVRASAVAGCEAATVGGAVLALDPDPSPVSIAGLPPILPALPPLHLGAVEVLGAGSLRINGAVFVNAEWGGVDENGEPAGTGTNFPCAITCTPILPLTRLRAADIRVVGGVDDPANYGHVTSGQRSPLRANKLPVPDPLRKLPAPTTAADPVNVVGTLRGGVTITNLPLLSPPVTLRPGVYDWIEVRSGTVIFQPGVYIIRSSSPLTGIALNIVAGMVTAEGVMFYITDSADYSPASGFPDALDGEARPASPQVPSLLPSVIINAGVLGSRFAGLDAPGSPFDGILIYQRRMLRKPIVIVAEQLLGSSGISGTIYAKWAQLVFAGTGTYDLRFAVGTVRIVSVLNCTLSPSNLFPPAEDVFLVE